MLTLNTFTILLIYIYSHITFSLLEKWFIRRQEPSVPDFFLTEAKYNIDSPNYTFLSILLSSRFYLYLITSSHLCFYFSSNTSRNNQFTILFSTMFACLQVRNKIFNTKQIILIYENKNTKIIKYRNQLMFSKKLFFFYWAIYFNAYQSFRMNTIINSNKFSFKCRSF